MKSKFRLVCINRGDSKANVNKISVYYIFTANCQYTKPQCQGNRQVIVHLFEWKWTDIANECEEYLGPKGFCAVQVSPPMEHVQGVKQAGIE